MNSPHRSFCKFCSKRVTTHLFWERRKSRFGNCSLQRWRFLKIYAPSRLPWRNSTTQRSLLTLDLSLRISQSREYLDYRDAIVLKKAWPLFRPDRKRKSGRFQTSSRFQKVPFLWHISVDSRPNCEDKVHFLWQISVDVRPHCRDKVSPVHFWSWLSKLYFKSPFSPSIARGATTLFWVFGHK